MDVTTVIGHLTAVKHYCTACYVNYPLSFRTPKVLAVYEYIITFDRELETFWKRKFTIASLLWFLNRYMLNILLISASIAAYVPFSDQICAGFVKYTGAMQILLNVASGLTLTLRVYALYGQARWVLALLSPILIAEIGVEAWAVAGGIPAMLPPGQVGCFLTGRPDQGFRKPKYAFTLLKIGLPTSYVFPPGFAAVWIGQLVFPTFIFLMTITRALRLRALISFNGSILIVMLRDGILYFVVIFIVNLANVFTYIFAPIELKFTNAPFTVVITTLMICRLMLNLKRAGSSEYSTVGISNLSFRVNTQTRPTYLGDLGEDLDIENLDQSTRASLRSDMSHSLNQSWASED